MPETLAGTGVLIRLGLRRDRWLLPLWIIGFALIAYSTALAGAELYPDMASRVEAATALNATASMVALFGRIYDPTSIGALSLIKYTAFMTAILAVLMVILAIRHTRGDEESGRLELLGGGRLGRAVGRNAHESGSPRLSFVFIRENSWTTISPPSRVAAGLPAMPADHPRPGVARFGWRWPGRR